jgi:hypothetical protein
MSIHVMPGRPIDRDTACEDPAGTKIVATHPVQS